MFPLCTGFNKTPLDGRFATDSKGVMSHVRSGRSDAYDSTSLFWALASMKTASNVVALRIDTDRSKQRETRKAITKFPLSKMASRRFVWVPTAYESKISEAREFLQLELQQRGYHVARIDEQLEELGCVNPGGKKANKIVAFLNATQPLLSRMVQAGWSSSGIVTRLTHDITGKDFVDLDIECCRQWARVFITQPVGRLTTPGHSLQLFMINNNQDFQILVGQTLMRYCFVSAQPNKSNLGVVMLKEILFRRHSRIGHGHSMTSAQLEYLWGEQASQKYH